MLDLNYSTLLGSKITLWRDALIINGKFIDCVIDDVTNGPFDRVVFDRCIFERCTFMSHLVTTN